MARNRQRAKDRKRQTRENGQPDDAVGPSLSKDDRSGEPPDAVGPSLSKDDRSGEPPDDDDAVGPSLSKDDRSGEPPDDDVEIDENSDDGDDAVDSEQLGLGAAEVAAPVKKQKGSKLVNFTRASWAELQRVDWPDRRQVGQATAVVLGFVVIAGAFLGLADIAAQALVDLIL